MKSVQFAPTGTAPDGKPDPCCWLLWGGINPDETGPGFKKIIIKPAVVGDLTWVKYGNDSVHGLIVSNWKREGGKLTMNVTIPINTTAMVYVPAKEPAGVKFLRMVNTSAVYAVGFGIISSNP